MQKKLILLDLDNTLFDSRAFRDDLFRTLHNTLQSDLHVHELSSKLYDRQMAEKGIFDTDVFIKDLSREIGVPIDEKEILAQIFDAERMKQSFHPEVLNALQELSNLGDIGILSQGEETFQSAKITAIKHLLHKDRIHVSRDKKQIMKQIFSEIGEFSIYFIDDMLPMLYEAKRVAPNVTTIWIKRGRYALKQEPMLGFKPDATIYRLDEAIPIIKG